MDLLGAPNPPSPAAERHARLLQQRQRQNRAPELTRDEKIEIRGLRKYTNWGYKQIADATQKTVRQVQWACNGPLTPQKARSGRPPGIRTPERLELQRWLLSGDFHREVSWSDLRFFLPPELSHYGETAIFTALRKLGYRRAKNLGGSAVQTPTNEKELPAPENNFGFNQTREIGKESTSRVTPG